MFISAAGTIELFFISIYHTEKGDPIELMIRKSILPLVLIAATLACNFSASGTPTGEPGATASSIPGTDTFTPPALTATQTLPATLTATVTGTAPPSETARPPTDTAIPTVPGLKARVTADRLSCRYGPGPEYLYLFALRATANIELIGRVDADNWNWVLVENQVPCWVNTDFLEIQGDFRSLPVVYPDIAKLPITPYYPRSEVLSAARNNDTNEVTVTWLDVPVSPGDFEDETMFTYIVEIWRCENGQILFEPLPANIATVNFVDEPGCSEPSRGRVWVQEKHGYAGPADIPWPEYP